VLFVSRAADLGQRFGQLTTETDVLRQQRVAHDTALRDYQETLAFGF
jgi:hypothetical protein